MTAGLEGNGDVEVSVVIPTHDRLSRLAAVLSALEAQRGAPAFEIVVVDDASQDGTDSWLRARRSTVPLRVLRQPQRGPAHARNAGVQAARGTWVAFLGDDTVPAPDWLGHHRRGHRDRGDDPRLAVLGRVEWHRAIRPTAFLRYLDTNGRQFGYGLIEDRERLDFKLFYSSNVSLRRDLLLREPFDVRFTEPAWDDTELGYRLVRRQGLRLVYEPAALVEHDHPTDVRSFCRRQETAGRAAAVFYDLHPEQGPMLGLGPAGPPALSSRLRQRLRTALAAGLQTLPVELVATWETIVTHHYLVGLHRGWRELQARRMAAHLGTRGAPRPPAPRRSPRPIGAG